MYDVWNASKLQFPVFAHVQDQRFFPVVAPCLEFFDRNFADHGCKGVSLEPEGRRPLRIFECVDGGLEQTLAAPGGFGSPGDQQCFLRNPIAGHDKKPSTHGQAARKHFVVQGKGSTYGNERIVLSHIQVESVTRDNLHLSESGTLEIVARRCRKLGVYFDGAHTGTQGRKARGHVAGSCADHQRAHAGLRVQRLQETSDNLGCEHVLTGEANGIFDAAEKAGCTIHLPYDVVVAKEFAPNPPSVRTVNVHEVAADEMILDVGPAAVEALADALKTCRTLVWNGPLGAFETPPFDEATVALAKTAAALTKEGSLVSVAGGGDTVAALNHAAVAQDFSFVSTAGGAFLEWMEGRTLPGVAALEQQG